MKNLVNFACLLFFFVLGIFAAWSSREFPNQNDIAENGRPTRDPAAIKRVYDFSNLQGSALDFATKQRIIDGFKVIKEKNDIGVELGHFVIKSAEGDKLFACQRYSKIILSFEGDGAAVGGELPNMEVEGKCEISADINSIAPIWIPISKFLNEPANDGEFDYLEGHVAKIKFSNVSDRWPKTWILRSVKMIDGSGKFGEVAIQSAELNSLSKSPVIVNF